MPIEERRIKFNLTEFRTILAPALLMVRGVGIDGNISKIEAHSSDMINGIANKRLARDNEIPHSFTITLTEPSGKTQTLELDHEFILNALIEHCLNHSIILARDFTKKANAGLGWIWLELATPIDEKSPLNAPANNLVFDE